MLSLPSRRLTLVITRWLSCGADEIRGQRLSIKNVQVHWIFGKSSDFQLKKINFVTGDEQQSRIGIATIHIL